jgi:NADPH:quinone reductase-like Zn-dependent oxidoreductase
MRIRGVPAEGGDRHRRKERAEPRRADFVLTSMQAVVHSEYGGPDVLQLASIPTPTPQTNELLVKVHAAALNPVDWHLVRGVPFPVRFMVGGLRRPTHQRGVGGDFSGTVAAVGSGVVTGFKAGDAVFGYTERAGALAEYLTIPADKAALKPARLTFEEAAAVPLAGLTALQILRKAQVHFGQHVLIVGAAGGIGTLAVQIAKARGAHVTGVQSTGACDLVRSLGADHVIDYTKEDFTKDHGRFDVVLDNVCNRALADVRRVVRPGGVIVPNGGGSPEKGVSIAGMLGALASMPFISQKILFGATKPNQADLRELATMLEAGTLSPVIDGCYPLAATADAFRQLEAGHAHGKIVVRIE